MFFSTNISPYLYLFSKVEETGLFFGFKPPNISLTNIFATLFGVPFKLSSVKSIPNVNRIFLTSSSIASILSKSLILKASFLKGVSLEVPICSSPNSSITLLWFFKFIGIPYNTICKDTNSIIAEKFVPHYFYD